MEKTFFLFLLFAVASLTGHPQSKTYFQQQVDYNIKVKLNVADKTLDAVEEIQYYNRSKDTLSFLWFHLWPNAYKNDRTPFSEQLLQNGRTDFYFSKEEQKGYINRLDFKVDGEAVKTEDSSAIDILKIYLNKPLLPGEKILISTPFHEKLPYNFSRGGYAGKGFQVTQWYPKPAVYDNLGWHPMSYLDQGEFFSEFGTYDVAITIPENYVVAATGILQDSSEINYLQLLSHKTSVSLLNKDRVNLNKQPIKDTLFKTLHYHQEKIHDFAWFANKNFLVNTDTMKLPSGRIISLYSFYPPSGKKTWEHSLDFMKATIRSRSQWLGEYPYDVSTAIEAPIGFTGGMEYPTITSITPMPSGRLLETLIEHEVGHNWNYGILASNERDHPWIDEGINSYYDRRYIREVSPAPAEPFLESQLISNRLPKDFDDFFYRNAIESKKDQPISTTSEKFSELNYNVIAYHKTALWLEQIEAKVGRAKMDSLMQTYYNNWKFKHPSPADIKNILTAGDPKMDSLFDLIDKRGPLTSPLKRKIKLSALINFRNTAFNNYIFLSPAIGYNSYDGGMIGGLLHNFTLPANKFQYLFSALYGTHSKQMNGLARLQYHSNSYGFIQQTLLSLTAEKFSSNEFTDSAGNKTFLNFMKLTPSVRLFFRERDPRSTVTRFIQWKTFLLKERNILFTRDTLLQQDVISFPYSNSYINQLKFVKDDHRALYPYRLELQGEQSANFAKLTFVGKYFFNYASGGGLNVRLFGGKFFYIGDKTLKAQFETDRYHLNLTGANGYEDYTYSNYFIGRNDFQYATSQQIMIRDGGFKVRSDLLSAKIGKTDDWLAALNFQSDIPSRINPLSVLPVKIPLKLFMDIGTYADAFKPNASTGKFLYDAGLQISLIRNLLNIYIPVAYSKVYADYYKSTITRNRFLKTISFSLDLQNLNLRKFNPEIFL